MGLVEQIAPARGFRHVEARLVPDAILGDLSRILLGLALGHLLLDDLRIALVEHVGAALQEQHSKDVLLELGSIHLAAQDIGGAKEMALKLGKGQGHYDIP